MFLGPINRIEGQDSVPVAASDRVRRAGLGEFAERVVGVQDEQADSHHPTDEQEEQATHPRLPDGDEPPETDNLRHFDARA